MKKPNQPKPRKLKKPTPVNWLDFITDDKPKLTIPVGPLFQVDVPDWAGKGYDESSTSRWLGTQVWPINDSRSDTKVDVIGQGRPDFCTCPSPGTIECVKRHVNDKKVQLQFDLGPAFWKWRFNEMGQDVSKLWSLEEQQMFDFLVKMNPMSEDKSFLNPALECFRNQRRETVVSYYFNVYVPRRMSIETRAGTKIVDTDDDDVDCGDSKVSRKRSRANSGNAKYERNWYLTRLSWKRSRADSGNAKHVKNRYLTGRR